MKKLTILCDLDDVLWDIVIPWVDSINELFGTSIDVNSITDWEIAKFFPTLTKHDVYTPLLDNNFWINFKPSPEGVWFVERILNDGHKLKIVTSSFYQNLHTKMEKFFECYPNIKWEDVTVTADKQSVKGDVLIDDGIHNLIGGDYCKILLTKSHNKFYETDSHGIKRVNSLTEAYDIIQTL